MGTWISNLLIAVIVVWVLSFCSSFAVNQKDVKTQYRSDLLQEEKENKKSTQKTNYSDASDEEI